MIRTLSVILFFIFMGVLPACTPFDSNKANKKLLLGNWVLYDLDTHLDDDTIFLSYMQDTAIIMFEKDSCYDYFVKPNMLNSYSYVIDNYELSTYINDSLISKLDILALSDDSLVLGRKSVKFKYRKFETDYQKILENLN